VGRHARDFGSHPAARQPKVVGLLKKKMFDSPEGSVEENTCGGYQRQKAPQRDSPERLEVKVLLAAVNPGDTAEKFRFKNGRVPSVESVALGNQDRIAVSVSSVADPPQDAMDEKAPVARVENYFAGGDSLNCAAADKHIIAGTNPGEHALAQDAEAHGAICANLQADGIITRAGGCDVRMLRLYSRR
jgi:hypothetical protein